MNTQTQSTQNNIFTMIYPNGCIARYTVDQNNIKTIIIVNYIDELLEVDRFFLQFVDLVDIAESKNTCILVRPSGTAEYRPNEIEEVEVENSRRKHMF